MDEAHEVRNQSQELRKRFKNTGLINPAEVVWEPKPTAGDHVRAVEEDILGGRDADIEQATKDSTALWGK